MPVTIDGNAGITFPQGATQIVGAGPAFDAYMTASQTVTSNVLTKIQLNAETFDTNSNYNTTNYRFTPTVAGYYQFNWVAVFSAVTTMTSFYSAIYKNGVEWVPGSRIAASLTAGVNQLSAGVSIILMNGSTDYVEIYGLIVGTGTLTIPGSDFSGVLVRGA